jgi:hypothetical protein
VSSTTDHPESTPEPESVLGPTVTGDDPEFAYPSGPTDSFVRGRYNVGSPTSDVDISLAKTVRDLFEKLILEHTDGKRFRTDA